MSIERFVFTGLTILLFTGCAADTGDPAEEGDSVGEATQALLQSGQTVTAQSGTTYYTTAGKHCIYAIPFGGVASNFTGACNSAGNADGLPGTSRFNAPYGLAVDDVNGYLYVTDTSNSAVRRVNMTSGRVATVVTQSAAVSAGSAAGFSISSFGPRGLALLDGGKLLITDGVNHLSWLYAAGTGTMSFHAGRAGVAGDVDGTGSAVRYNTPDLASTISCTTSFFSAKCALIYEPVTGKRRMTDVSGKVSTP